MHIRTRHGRGCVARTKTKNSSKAHSRIMTTKHASTGRKESNLGVEHVGVLQLSTFPVGVTLVRAEDGEVFGAVLASEERVHVDAERRA